MSSPKPLTPQEASSSLAHRMAGRADRLRQIATKFGLRPYRVFLVWTRWTGGEHGAGVERELRRVELLPSPAVRTSVQRTLLNPGVFPTGTVSVSKVSATYQGAMLTGEQPPAGQPGEGLSKPWDFFYELRTDGRQGDSPVSKRYRLADDPSMLPGNMEWVFALAPISEEDV